MPAKIEKSNIVSSLENSPPLTTAHQQKLVDIFKNSKPVLWWPGKKRSRLVAKCSLTLTEQVFINQVKQPITNQPTNIIQLNDYRESAKWQNMLIKGDNTAIMQTLQQTEFKEKIIAAGGIKLIYIDPPFASGINRSVNVKDHANINSECLAYFDKWRSYHSEYCDMLYEKLLLCYNLLAENGSIYVHCDWRANALIRLLLDEIFGPQNFRNEIVWQSALANSANKNRKFVKSHETIFFYSKSKDYIWNSVFVPYSDKAKKIYRHKDKNGIYQLGPCDAPGGGGYFYSLDMGEKTPSRGYSMPKKTALDWISKDILVVKKNRVPLKKWYFKKDGVPCKDLWMDIGKERGYVYATQKPVKLLERIISASSNQDDLVADFFCGSGSTLIAAQKLNRKWIGCDLGDLSTHICKKRLISLSSTIQPAMFNIFKLKYNQTQPEKLLPFATVLNKYKAKLIKLNKQNYYTHQKRLVICLDKDLGHITQQLSHYQKICQTLKLTGVTILGFEFKADDVMQLKELAKKNHLNIEFKIIKIRAIDEKIAIEFKVYQFIDASISGVKTCSGSKIKVTINNFHRLSGEDEALDSQLNYIDHWSIDIKPASKKLPQTLATAPCFYAFKQKNKPIALQSNTYQIKPGRYNIKINVVDIFGQETSHKLVYQS